MAIEKDIPTRTAVSIDYTRTGNTLHRRERHGVKDATNTIIITFEEFTDYVGQAALKYLDQLKATESSSIEFQTIEVATNNEREAEIQSNITFLNDQITEIEALL